MKSLYFKAPLHRLRLKRGEAGDPAVTVLAVSTPQVITQPGCPARGTGATSIPSPAAASPAPARTTPPPDLCCELRPKNLRPLSPLDCFARVQSQS